MRRLPALAASLLLLAGGCASIPEAEQPPAERVARAAALIEDDRNIEARQVLDDLRGPVAGTSLEGEVVCLLARARYGIGEYADAEVLFGAYLDRFPRGPRAAEALYGRAQCFLRQAERLNIGFFRFEQVLPHDRDITPLAQAETLLNQYVALFPGDARQQEALAQLGELRGKRGLHELAIAEFYLRKDNPAAALARAQPVEEGDYPADVREQAGRLAREARSALPGGGVKGAADDGR
jgi:outer membrane assembly lipoprotein YfiO